MGKISEYPTATALTDDDVVLGNNGTATSHFTPAAFRHDRFWYKAGSVVGAARVAADATIDSIHVATVPNVTGDLVLSIKVNGSEVATATVSDGNNNVAVTGVAQAVTAGQVLSVTVTSGTHAGVVAVDAHQE